MTTLNFNPMPNAIHSLSTNLCVALLLSLLVLFVPLSATSLLAQEGTVIHTVAVGEYLSSIARRYNVTVASLMAYNNIRDANLIRPGQQIRIPPAVKPLATPTSAPAQPTAVPLATSRQPRLSPPSTSPSGYTAAGEPVITVRRGDTLSGIAIQFGVTVSSIVQRNNLPSLVIVVSQRLIIPLRSAPIAPVNAMPTPVSASGVPDSQPTATPEAVTADVKLLPTAATTPLSKSP